MSDQPRINVPDMCELHQSLLVHQARYRETDPWRSLIIMTQIALFQAATADSTFYTRIDGNLQRIGEIGCLACFKPDAFGEIVEAAKQEKYSPGSIKKLGERWVKRSDSHAERYVKNSQDAYGDPPLREVMEIIAKLENK